jgi:hypothetical protein
MIEEFGGVITKALIAALLMAPVPLRDIVCGEPETLSLILSEAVRAPLAVGTKLIDAWHDNVCPRLGRQADGLLITKSPALVPVTVGVLNKSNPVPLFVSVRACAGDVVPINTEPNVSGPVGAMLIEAALYPVPDSDTVCVGAELVIVRVAVSGVVRLGRN